MPVGQAANAKKTMIKGGLPDYEITRDENAVEPGMLAAYTRPNMDKPTGLIVIYGEHPVLRHIVETYQAQYAPLTTVNEGALPANGNQGSQCWGWLEGVGTSATNDLGTPWN